MSAADEGQAALEAARLAIDKVDARVDLVQGFRYGTTYVVRDLSLPRAEQMLHRTGDQVEHEAAYHRIRSEIIARAVITAYLAALENTHRLVPLESTAEMDEASDGTGWPEQTWGEMIGAAPPAPGLED